MNKLKWVVSMLFVVLLITPGYAITLRSGDALEIAENEVIDDDLILFAQSIDIKGKVNGDVCAFAQEVKVSGEIEGSIFSGAATIDIDAKSVKTIWAMGGNITISGLIDRNVLLFGGSLLIDDNARISKDLIAYGGKFNVEGDISGEIKGGVGKFVMSGKSGNININAGETKIKSGAQISGDLVLESAEEPVIEEGVVITGETKLEKPEEKGEGILFAFAPMLAFFIAFMKIVMFIAKIIVGVILIALFKKFVRKVMDTFISKPWLSLGWGFLGFIVIPVAVMILFAVLIGFPIAVFGTYVYTILIYLSSIFVAFVVGEKIIQLFKKEGEISLYVSFIIGIIVLFVLGLIPVLGFIINILVLLFGMGMLLLGSWNLLKEMREKKLI